MKPRMAGVSERALVLVAHGTDNAGGRRTVQRLTEAVARALPSIRVVDAYVDVQHPKVGAVVESLVAEGLSVVVVPLLLSTGYHVQVDIADAVSPHAAATAAPALGPHPLLAQLLRDRLIDAGAEPGDAVVLAAAGSSRPDAATATGLAATYLQHVWRGPVTVGFGSAATPSVVEAVAQARRDGATRVAVAAYLLGEGLFHDRLYDAGADVVTAPLGNDDRIVRVALERADEAADGYGLGRFSQ